MSEGPDSCERLASSAVRFTGGFHLCDHVHGLYRVKQQKGVGYLGCENAGGVVSVTAMLTEQMLHTIHHSKVGRTCVDMILIATEFVQDTWRVGRGGLSLFLPLFCLCPLSLSVFVYPIPLPPFSLPPSLPSPSLPSPSLPLSLLPPSLLPPSLLPPSLLPPSLLPPTLSLSGSLSLGDSLKIMQDRLTQVVFSFLFCLKPSDIFVTSSDKSYYHIYWSVCTPYGLSVQGTCVLSA